MEPLCISQNKIEIVYEAKTSHVATHFEDSPPLKNYVIEALRNTIVSSDSMLFEHTFEETIGFTDLVSTDEHDEIIFAKRINRDVYTRFTKSKESQPCSTVTIALDKIDDRTYRLWSAWIGFIGPSFPGDANESPESVPYWSKHALVWGTQEIQPGAETPVSPW